MEFLRDETDALFSEIKEKVKAELIAELNELKDALKAKPLDASIQGSVKQLQDFIGRKYSFG